MKKFVDDREQESRRFTRASLGTCHQVPTSCDDRKRVFLHRGGHGVFGSVDVVHEIVVELCLGEGGDARRCVTSCNANGDVFILRKVNSGVVNLTENVGLAVSIEDLLRY